MSQAIYSPIVCFCRYRSAKITLSLFNFPKCSYEREVLYLTAAYYLDIFLQYETATVYILQYQPVNTTEQTSPDLNVMNANVGFLQYNFICGRTRAA